MKVNLFDPAKVHYIWCIPSCFCYSEHIILTARYNTTPPAKSRDLKKKKKSKEKVFRRMMEHLSRNVIFSIPRRSDSVSKNKY